MRFRGRDPLRAGDIGRRVTVRHRLPDGASTDVVGELLATGEIVEVRRKDGTIARIDASQILAARVHPQVL